MIGSMALTLVAALTAPIVSETIDVDRIGRVDLKSFTCSDTPRSTVIQRVCYARPQRVMIVSLRGDYRASCGMPPNLYRNFITADSMGSFYSHAIGDNPVFRCHAPLQR
ncbi:MAG: KTSC domain-containing protein [Rhizobiales bacterium]|nr:KTSC domain-containing protein [Hyphomicrobiales bacterium]